MRVLLSTKTLQFSLNKVQISFMFLPSAFTHGTNPAFYFFRFASLVLASFLHFFFLSFLFSLSLFSLSICSLQYHTLVNLVIISYLLLPLPPSTPGQVTSMRFLSTLLDSKLIIMMDLLVVLLQYCRDVNESKSLLYKLSKNWRAWLSKSPSLGRRENGLLLSAPSSSCPSQGKTCVACSFSS